MGEIDALTSHLFAESHVITKIYAIFSFLCGYFRKISIVTKIFEWHMNVDTFPPLLTDQSRLSK